RRSGARRTGSPPSSPISLPRRGCPPRDRGGRVGAKLRGMPPQTKPAATQVSAAAIREATQRLQGVVERTPLQPWQRMSELTGARVLIKREDMQPVRSYKLRGALNLMISLT